MKLKEILLPTFALLLICVIITGALSVTNYYTKDIIAAEEQQTIRESMEKLIPGGEYTDISGSQTAFSATVNNTPAGTIFITEAMGYKSYVKVMTAFDPAGQIINIHVIHCADESPGIGQKVGTDSAFLAQFAGKTESIETIDAITGATYSSKAVQEAVNKAIDALEQYGSINTVTATNVTTGGDLK